MNTLSSNLDVAAEYRLFKSLKPVFISGMSRSGTSLMHRLLDGHPQLLTYPFEDCLIKTFFQFPLSHPDRLAAQESLSRRDGEGLLVALQRFPRLKYAVDPKIVETLQDYESKLAGSIKINFKIDLTYFKRCFIETISSVLEEWTIYEVLSAWMFSYFCALGINHPSSYSGWVTKCPESGTCIFAYAEAFPHCKVIHMLRDPRASWLSFREAIEVRVSRFILPSSVEIEKLTAHLNGCKTSFANRRDASRWMGNSFLTVRYEGLVTNTEHTMQGVSDFLSISFSDTLKQPTLLQQNWGANSGFHIETSSKYRVFPDSLARWRTSLRWYEHLWIESYLANELLEYGYTDRILFRNLKKIMHRCLNIFYRVRKWLYQLHRAKQ